MKCVRCVCFVLLNYVRCMYVCVYGVLLVLYVLIVMVRVCCVAHGVSWAFDDTIANADVDMCGGVCSATNTHA